MFNHKFFPQLKQQPNFIAFVCTTKFVSGWAAVDATSCVGLEDKRIRVETNPN